MTSIAALCLILFSGPAGLGLASHDLRNALDHVGAGRSPRIG